MLDPNELSPDLLSTAAFNIMPGAMSGSRLQMLGSHLTQMLVLRGSTPRRCITGVEREYGKYTFKVKMPVDATIIDVIPKYPETIGLNAIQFNPLTVVLYMDVETREVGMLEIPLYHTKHQRFGFRYNRKRTTSALVKGASIRKGTIFADSPSIDDNNDYKYGVEVNVATLSLPGVIEDGIIISKSLAKKMTTSGFESCSGSWGKRYYPLNLYGDDNHYKPFPDIGERVRPDGLLFAFREYDDLLDPINMTPSALRNVSMMDKKVYTKASAKVIDISTRFDPKGPVPDTPAGMDEQARRYHNAQLTFYNALIDNYERMMRESLQRKETLRISKHLHRMLVEAYLFKLDNSRVKATRIVQRQPLDEWRVDITVEYDLEPTKAFKLTDTAGGKGVACQVWDDEDMPVDKHGTRADAIVDGNPTINRMNCPRLYEQHLNGASDQIEREFKALAANGLTDEVVEYCWKRILRYYQIVSPVMYNTLTSPTYTGTPRQHIESILAGKHALRLFLPTNNEAEIEEMFTQLDAEFPIDIGPVTFRGRSGNVVTTVDDVLIASIYMIQLEKTGDDWSAVSSGTLQQHGILSKLTRYDKNSRPGRASATRTLGEDELRLIASVSTNNTTAQELIPEFGLAAADGLAAAELADLANSPAVHMEANRVILTAPNPTNIDRLIDRKKFPRGQSRSLMFVKHHLEVAGIGLVKQDDINDTPSVYLLEEMSVDDDGEPLEDIDEEEAL